MGLNLVIKYGSQVVSGDAGYLFGKARNQLVAGDGNGTPLEADWLNDLFGWQQALLWEASTPPSLVPDKIGASQYLDAIKYVTRHIAGDVFVTAGGGSLGNGTVHARGFITDAGTSLGSTNIITSSQFFGPQIFDASATVDFNAQINILRSGILIQPGAVIVGWGFDGLVVNAGGLLCNAGSPATFNETAEFNAPVSVNEELVCGGPGRIRETVAYAPDANHTFAQGDGTIIVAKAGTVTATRTWTLNDATGDGARLKLINYTTFAMTLHNGGGGSIVSVPASQLPASSGAGTVPGVLELIWLNNGTYTGWSRAS